MQAVGLPTHSNETKAPSSGLTQTHQNSTIELLPTDLVKHILTRCLDPLARAKASQVCKRWYRLSETRALYLKGQLKGRLKILEQVLIHYPTQSDPGEKLKRQAVDYLSKTPDFTQPVVTQKKGVLDPIVNIFKTKARLPSKQNPNEGDNALCVAIQKYLEKRFKPQKKFNILTAIDNPEFEITSDDPYERQGVKECLTPMVRMIKWRYRSCEIRFTK